MNKNCKHQKNEPLFSKKFDSFKKILYLCAHNYIEQQSNMKKNCALLLLACMAAPVSITAQTPDCLKVKELTLSNGMTVWLNEDHSQPKVFGAVVVRAGAKDCPGTGIAHYFEHIMFKGTDRIGTVDYAAERPWLDSISAQYDLLGKATQAEERAAIQKKINQLSLKASEYAIPNEFDRLIARFGGSHLNAATSMDVTYYHNSFLPQFIQQWCWLNSERLLNPVFRLFQGELENVYEEKNRSEDAFGGALNKALKAVFKDHPYGEPILGTTDNLKNPNLSEMAAFFKKYYVAQNMGLILCGDIQADTLQTLLEQTFGRVAKSTNPPVHQATPLQPFVSNTVDIKLPIPLVKVQALVYQAPTDFEADADVLDLCSQLLYNEKAGMLDSLINEHKVLGALTQRLAFKDAGLQFLLVIPKLPFGKMKKAQAICLEQIERVKRGDFSEETLEELKSNLLQEQERNIETIDDRANVMIDAFSQGQSWPNVLNRMERIKRISKADVVRVANKYFTDQYLTLHKKFGTEPKETLKQPGYEPVKPKHAGAKSQYAHELEALPVAQQQIRLMDFDKDVHCRALSPHATLYTKENPVNDLFTFTLRFRDGKRNTPLLELLSNYLGAIGTDSLKKQQLGKAWQRLGVSIDFTAEPQYFDIKLTGFDAQLKPALSLLSHFLQHAKADKEALSELKQTAKVNDKSFGKTKEDVMPAMLEWSMYGQRSSFMRQPSLKEIKALSNETMMALFKSLQQYDCELFYCGRQPESVVAEAVKSSLPIDQCKKKPNDTYRKMLKYEEPTVYFYHVPKSRQNYVLTYELLAPASTPLTRATNKLWSQYLGSGMSSVLFQNIREFQSLAYSTQGNAYVPSFAKHAGDSISYVTITGTQADKTAQVMHCIDSLMHQLPIKEENLEASRQEVLNNIQNGYPSFRTIAERIAEQKNEGFTQAKDAMLIEQLPAISANDIVSYHQRYVANNQRIWIVIGDRKSTDFNRLQQYGKVVELKKSDIFR